MTTENPYKRCKPGVIAKHTCEVDCRDVMAAWADGRTQARVEIVAWLRWGTEKVMRDNPGGHEFVRAWAKCLRMVADDIACGEDKIK